MSQAKVRATSAARIKDAAPTKQRRKTDTVLQVARAPLSSDDVLKQLLRCVDQVERAPGNVEYARALLNEIRALAFKLRNPADSGGSSVSAPHTAELLPKLTELVKRLRSKEEAVLEGLKVRAADFNPSVKSFGWHPPERNESGDHHRWCGGQPIASIALEDPDLTLKWTCLKVLPMAVDQLAPGVISFSVNNRAVAPVVVKSDSGFYYFWINVENGSPLKELSIRTGKVYAPSELKLSQDDRKLGICVFSILEAHSTN